MSKEIVQNVLIYAALAAFGVGYIIALATCIRYTIREYQESSMERPATVAMVALIVIPLCFAAYVWYMMLPDNLPR